MAKTAKRVKRKSAPKQLTLTPLSQVERDLRASVRREKNIGKLQNQLRRALANNRAWLTILVEFLKEHGFIIVPSPASQQQELL